MGASWHDSSGSGGMSEHPSPRDQILGGCVVVVELVVALAVMVAVLIVLYKVGVL